MTIQTNMTDAMQTRMQQQQTMNQQDRARIERQTELINQNINLSQNRNRNAEPGQLGKESFLRLLVTELSHQDPTRPMEDRDFIAQMAQFSSLEQMQNMNREIQNLFRSSRSSEAFSLLGKRVDAVNQETGTRISGTVRSIRMNNNQYVLMVGNREVSLSDIQQVHENGAERSNTSQPQSGTSDSKQ